MSRRSDTPEKKAVERPKGFDDFELRLGDIMRGERATLGKSLLDVQRDLKIKATYIAAIENADPSAFESPGFIAGYVRSYARYLSLDPEWAYKTFCEEGNFVSATGLKSGPAAKKSPPKGLTPMGARDPLAQPSVSFIPIAEAPLSRIEAGAIGSIAVLAALIGAIGYGGWAVLQEVQKVQFTPVDQTPVVLSQLDPLEPAAAAPEMGDDSGAIAAVPTPETFDRLYRPQALDVPVLTARDGPIATIRPGSLGALPPEPEDTRDIAQATPLAEPPAPPQPPETPVQVVAELPPEVALLAVRPSWVRVRAADGTIIFEKILDAGERFVLPKTEEPPVLRAGNAGSLYCAVGDQTYGPAGQGAAVIRDVVLSLDAVVGTYAIADLDSDADLARFTAVAEAASD
ncbi:MAG: helix-turn-helix domain-containing protein [Rhodobacteraceae bacterium]|nr:helix-turn-helix domain-containing protein [Paracoccaceae bacterium]